MVTADFRASEAGWHAAELERYGAELGSKEAWELAELANRHAPELHRYDSLGNRIDVVEFHPATNTLLLPSAAVATIGPIVFQVLLNGRATDNDFTPVWTPDAGQWSSDQEHCGSLSKGHLL